MQRSLKYSVVLLFILALVGVLLLISGTRINLSSQANSLDSPLGKIPAIKTSLETESVYQSAPVIDLSGWQLPQDTDYTSLSKSVIGAVIRVQNGIGPIKASSSVYSNGEDTAYKEHIIAFQKKGIPVAVYAYLSGKSVSAMKAQADAFYARAKDYNPTFWFLDIEDPSPMSVKTLNDGVQAFRAELQAKGIQNIGIYSTAYFIDEYSLDLTPFKAVWIADYGQNTGTWNSTPNTTISYQMHQYTNNGSLGSYNGGLDLSRVMSQAAYDKIFLRK